MSYADIIAHIRRQAAAAAAATVASLTSSLISVWEEVHVCIRVSLLPIRKTPSIAGLLLKKDFRLASSAILPHEWLQSAGSHNSIQ